VYVTISMSLSADVGESRRLSTVLPLSGDKIKQLSNRKTHSYNAQLCLHYTAGS